MRARSVARLGVGALALWGVVAAVALWTEQLQFPTAPATVPATASEPEPEPGPAPAPATGPATATATAPSPATASPPWTRYRVCTATGPLQLLRIAGTPRPRYLVHCGSSLELIGFDALGGQLEPRRIAHFEVSVPEPGLGAEAGGLASGDLDGDGLVDLLIGSVLRDDRETVSGGRLHWLRGAADGSFVGARRLGDAAATRLAFAGQAAAAGAELVALRTGEPRLGEPTQLWSYAAGAAPQRRDKRALGPGADALAVLDLNLDGRDEAFVLLGAPPALREVALDLGASVSVTELPSQDAAPRELQVADLDSDGHADLIVLGDRLTWFPAAAGPERPAPRALFEAATLRDLQLVNVLGDARPDLVAYAHPELVAFEQRPDGSFVRRDLYRRQSPALGTLSLRVDQLDADAQPELLLFGSSEAEPGGIDLVVIGDPMQPEHLAEISLPLLDGPLSLRSTLP
jgi:hypothetical protein